MLRNQIIFIQICMPKEKTDYIAYSYARLYLHYDKCAFYSLFLFVDQLDSNINSDYRLVDFKENALFTMI